MGTKITGITQKMMKIDGHPIIFACAEYATTYFITHTNSKVYRYTLLLFACT